MKKDNHFTLNFILIPFFAKMLEKQWQIMHTGYTTSSPEMFGNDVYGSVAASRYVQEV